MSQKMTDPNTQKLQKLEKQLTMLEGVVKLLGAKIAYLERENSRRKSEVNQISNVLRK